MDQWPVASGAQSLAGALEKKGLRIVSGGTDTHLILVDLTAKKITGADASRILGSVNITVNKNLIPFDAQPASVTSGVRLGTAAVSTRGMQEKEMQKIAELINLALESKDDLGKLAQIRKETIILTERFPLYAELLK